MELTGSQTEKNLLEAFQGESMARNKYTFFASKAKKAGYLHLAKIYEDTANNEKEHAKIWYKHLHNEDISDTIENINNCIENELYEHKTMYPEFAKIAKEEGFDNIAKHFEEVAEIEGMHQKRFEALKKDIETNKVFIKDKEIEWECSNCGYIHEGTMAPKICPACSHPKEYFWEHCQNY